MKMQAALTNTVSVGNHVRLIALAASAAALLLIAPGAARADITDAGDIKAGDGLVAGSTTFNPGLGHLLLTQGVVPEASDIFRGTAGLFLNGQVGTDADVKIQNDGNVLIGLNANAFEKLTVDGSIGFTDGSSPLLINSLTGDLAGSRMFWGHSAAFPNWGIFYNDATDRMHFRQSAGQEFATFDFPQKRVGIGTATDPKAALHVKRNDGSAQLRVEEVSATTASRTLLDLRNNGATLARFLNTKPNPDSYWDVGNRGDFTINANGGSPLDLRLTPAGNLTIAGTLTQGSDRRLKEAIRNVRPSGVLEKLIELPLSTWRYKADRIKARHIGPMAQDFADAFGLGANRRTLAPGDVGGVALAAIKGLERRVAALEAENRALAEEVRGGG